MAQVSPLADLARVTISAVRWAGTLLRFEAWCATGGDGVVGEWSRAELEDHVRDEHSTFTWLLEPMFDRAGFDIAEAVHSDDGIFAQYVLRAR